MVNYRDSHANTSCGYSEQEIRARAVSTSSEPWKVRCLNTAAHKHEDKNPSAFYYSGSGWYGCNVCDLSGFATDRVKQDRDSPKGTTAKRSRSSKGRVSKEGFIPDRVPEEAKLTSIHPYTRTDGTCVHRVRRYDWVETENGKPEKRKEYIPDHIEEGQWRIGEGKIPWQPYNADKIGEASKIAVVEGEKCADALSEVLPADIAVVTSAFGAESAFKCDWSCIANTGLSVTFLPDGDEKGERYIEAVARRLGDRDFSVLRMPEPYNDVADYLAGGREISELKSVEYEPPGEFQKLETIKEKPIEWLWEGMLPRGKFTMLIGKGGTNKSTLALWVAACLSRGGIKTTPCEPCRVAYYSSEDDAADTIRPRARLMGADLDRLTWLTAPFSPGRRFDFTLKEHLDALVRNASEFDLVVVDPIIDICGDANTNSASVVRRALEDVVDRICDSGTAVLGIHHERKDSKRDDHLPDRASGSHAWVAKARTVWMLHKSPIRDCSADAKKRDMGTDSDSYGVLLPIKTNIAKLGVGYHVEMPVDKKTGNVIVQVGAGFKAAPGEAIAQYQRSIEPSASEQLAAYALSQTKGAVDRGVIAVSHVFEREQRTEMPLNELVTMVREEAGIGVRNANEAIRKCTHRRRPGKEWLYRPKHVEQAENEA